MWYLDRHITLYLQIQKQYTGSMNIQTTDGWHWCRSEIVMIITQYIKNTSKTTSMTRNGTETNVYISPGSISTYSQAKTFWMALRSCWWYGVHQDTLLYYWSNEGRVYSSSNVDISAPSEPPVITHITFKRFWHFFATNITWGSMGSLLSKITSKNRHASWNGIALLQMCNWSSDGGYRWTVYIIPPDKKWIKTLKKMYSLIYCGKCVMGSRKIAQGTYIRIGSLSPRRADSNTDMVGADTADDGRAHQTSMTLLENNVSRNSVEGYFSQIHPSSGKRLLRVLLLLFIDETNSDAGA